MLRSYCVLIPALLGLSVAASASPIRTSGSSYGPQNTPVNSTVGIFNEQTFLASFGSDNEVFDFQITTSDVTSLTLTSASGAAFFQDDTSDPTNPLYGFGAFISDPSNPRTCPAFSLSLTSTLCGPVPVGTSMPSDNAGGTATQVTFSISGDSTGLVFFAVVPNPTGADLMVTPTYTTSATPEPRLWPILGVALLAVPLWRRRRSSARVA